MNEGLHAELLDVMGSDITVVNTARVSLAKHHTEFDDVSDTRLIKYLAREGHWTPFAHPQVQFRIKAPIFVARQFFKHTTGTVRSEISRRYVDDVPTFFLPEVWRSRPEGNIKQGSGDPVLDETAGIAYAQWGYAMASCRESYGNLLAAGVAPEMARMVLPQAMITEWVETASLFFWARLCKLRLDPHAQQESQDLARQIANHIAPLFPVSWGALLENHDG